MVTALLPLLAAAVTPAARERRCGWLENPTPGNVWLTDRQATWLIGVQGGYQADGDWGTDGVEWVSRNVGSYGYGCVCLTVTSDRRKERIVRIYTAKPRTLRQCRADAALRGKEPK